MPDPQPNRLPPKILCPRCGEVTAWTGNPNRPFCSERCKLIDLGAWASEDYKIPGKRLGAENPEQAREAGDGDESEEPKGNSEE